MSHPFPFRTRKLRPDAPMVLRGKLRGRVGRCRIYIAKALLSYDKGAFLCYQASSPPADAGGYRYSVPAGLGGICDVRAKSRRDVMSITSGVNRRCEVASTQVEVTLQQEWCISYMNPIAPTGRYNNGGSHEQFPASPLSYRFSH